jgi:hypothetical protein
VQWLALVLIGVCVGCTGPNPAYESFFFDSDVRDAARAPDGGSAADRPTPADRTADGAAPVDGPAGTSVDGSAAVPRLLGYWKFDEQPGATTASDSSGNGHHGTLEALDSSRVWVTGRSGNAIEFPATPDLEAGVRVPLTPALAGLSRFTIAAWIYRTTMISMQNTSVVSRQLGGEFWEVYNLSTINSDELVIYAGTDVTPAPRVRVAGGAPLGVWVHVAATYDGSTLSLYRDGQLLGSSPLARALPADSSPLYIGTNKNPSRNDVFMGLIDEVVLFSVALPASAIVSLRDGTSPASL